MVWYGILAVAALAHAAPQRAGSSGGGGRTALLRFGCSQVVIERLDPLVNPSMNPSPHQHQVVGGNAFNASMPSTDIAEVSSCTTCHFAEDFSNYWTANLYFRARNGSYKRVPQIANQGLNGDNGGVTVYYASPGAKLTTAFKPGFRMLTGDPGQSKSAGLGKNMQSCYRCFTGPNFGGNVNSPCFDPKIDTDSLPAGPCLGGIRSNIMFPTCWDGKNLDSPNHKDHVSYPVTGPQSFTITTGKCPDSHPVKIPQITLEIMWDTTGFNDKSLWPEDGSQPFVLSNGDKTGYAQHADYVFGWKGDSLQKAMDNGCYITNCPALKSQTPKVKNQCSVPVTVKENTDGWLSQLPGGGTGM